MTNLDIQIRSAVTERTAEWLVAHRAGALSERENADFFVWLKTSPMHVEEYLALAALEGELNEALSATPLSLQELRELGQQDAAKVTQLGAVRWWRDAQNPSTQLVPRQPWMIGAIVAALLGLALTVWWAHQDLWPPGAQTYQTARGAQANRRLEDGSTLDLDTDSAVTVRFSPRQRQINLDRGQALFQVAHDTSRPFRVVAGNAVVVAVGTEFDVYRRAGAVLVTVLEGRVTVSTPQPAAQRALLVSAGEQIEISAAGALGTPTHVEASRAVAWLQRQIVFNRRPLGELAAEFNRYNTIPVVVTDPQLRNLPVSGVFNVYDLDSLTAFLTSLDGVSVQRSALDIRVSRVSPPKGTASR